MREFLLGTAVLVCVVALALAGGGFFDGHLVF
jgi:hypothetical protein